MRPPFFSRSRLHFSAFALVVAATVTTPALAAFSPVEVLERVMVGLPEGLQIGSKILGRPMTLGSSEDLQKIMQALRTRQELQELRMELEIKAQHVGESLERRGLEVGSSEAAALFKRAASAEFMIAPESAEGEIDFVSGGRYDLTRSGYERAREAFINGMREKAERAVKAVVPTTVQEQAARAQELAQQLRETAESSLGAAKIILGEATPPLKWIDPIVEVYGDLQKLANATKNGKLSDIPEAAGALLKKSEELYGAMVRTLEKLPPGKRRDAYVVVLGDLETLIKASKQAYAVSEKAVRVGAPVAIDGVKTVTRAVRTVSDAGNQLSQAIDQAQDLTIGRARRLIARGDDAIESRVAAQYDEVWRQYLAGRESNPGKMLARARALQGKNFGVPWPMAGKLKMAERGARLSGFLDWAKTIEAPLREKVTLLSDRAHPVLNHFVDVFMRGQSRIAGEFLAKGGEWEVLAPREREAAVDALRAIVDSEADGLIVADSDRLRSFVPEIDLLKDFCRRWQELTDIERRIALAGLLEFNKL